MTSQQGLAGPFSFGLIERGSQAADLTFPQTGGTATGIGTSFPQACLPNDLFDVWMNVKSFYYRFLITYETLDFSGFVSGIQTGSAAGVTRRSFNEPYRSPGVHTTFRDNNNVLSTSSVSDITIDFSSTFFSWRSTSRYAWYPKCVVRASFSGVTLSNGSGIGAGSPLVFNDTSLPSVPLDINSNGLGTNIGNVIIVDASINVLERYDMITFTPMYASVGDTVTVTCPPFKETNAFNSLREGFKWLTELYIGDVKVPSFEIAGANFETVTFTIPPSATTGTIRFVSKPTETSNNTDYYYTRQFLTIH